MNLQRLGPSAQLGLLLALLLLLWAPDALFGSTVYWSHDLRHHHYPWRMWAASEWLAGRIPSWAPEVGAGFPLAADGQAGAFYLPTVLLFAILPSPLAMNWTILLHTWWAGMGAGALARVHGLGGAPAMFAAVAFAFSGFLSTHVVYLGMHHVVSWLPWLLWAVHKGHWARVSLCCVAMLLAGHPQVALFGLLLGGVVSVVERRALPFTIAAIVAVWIASPQLAATWELLLFSSRSEEVTAAFAGIGSLPPPEILNGVLPQLFGFDRPGDVLQTYYHRGQGYWGMGVNHWETAFFLGVPVVFFAAWSRGRRLWMVLAGVSLVLMLGSWTPVWGLVTELPVFDRFRFPVRFSSWLTLIVGLLAADGLHQLLTAERSRQRLASRWALGLSAAVLVGASVAWGALQGGEERLRSELADHYAENPMVADPTSVVDPDSIEAALLSAPEVRTPEEISQQVEQVIQAMAHATSPASPAVWGPALVLLVLGLGLGALYTGRISGSAFSVGLISLVFVDLAAFGRAYQVRVPWEQVTATSSALETIRSEEGRWRTTVVDRRQDPSLDTELITANLGLVQGTRDVLVPSPLRIVRSEALLARVGLDVGDRGPQKVTRLLENRDLVDLLGVRWLLSVHELEGPDLVELRDGAVRLYRNDSALPGAFVVGCAQVVETREEAWSALHGLDPRKVAVVEVPAVGRVPRVKSCEDGSGVGTARIELETPQEMNIEVTTDRPSILVQNDTWYPGWRVTVDDEEVAQLRVDFAFRGVEVPEGTHRVRFFYDGMGVRLVWLFPAGLFALIVLGRWREEDGDLVSEA